MISVLALDLDDTLVRSDGTISERTLDLLKAWEESGREVVIATGRPPRMTRLIPDVLHHLHWVCYNGAVIHKSGEEIYQDLIPAAETRQIVECILAESPSCRLGLEIGDQLFLNQAPDRPDATHVMDILSIAEQSAAKVILTLDQFGADHPLFQMFPDTARVLISDKYNLIQIMPRSTSKARALQHLVESWGLSMQNVIAFGDDTNDVEMVRDAGIGVAMGNGVPEVKAVADRITGTNDEDGVASVLEEILTVEAEAKK